MFVDCSGKIYSSIDSHFDALKMKFAKKGIAVEIDSAVRDLIFKKAFEPGIQSDRIVRYVVSQTIEDPLTEIILSRLNSQIIKHKYLIQITDENVRIADIA